MPSPTSIDHALPLDRSPRSVVFLAPMPETSHEVERLRRERDVLRRLVALGDVRELEPLLEEALEALVATSGAERAYVEIHGGSPGDRDWSLASGLSEARIEQIRRAISRGIIAEALATGEVIVTHSAVLDERFQTRKSVQSEQIDAVLCAPIGGSARNGVVYLQGSKGGGPFAQDDVELIELFARALSPFVDRLLARRRAAHSQDATAMLRGRFRLEGVVGRSRAFALALEQAMIAAPLDVTVLITGPSGAGKSQLARAIHDNSRRAGGPFVALNCAALPTTLLESELFGARAGSHSEAKRDQPGKVAAAEGGTLLLDEIAEIPLEAQAKLLQLIQEKEYYPVGAAKPLRADVRIVAATNAPLADRMRQGSFREDLFYRLSVLPVELPPLASRPEDLRDLSRELLDRAVAELSLPALRLSESAAIAIEAAEWPGNVRQLENVLKAAAIRAAAAKLEDVGARHLFPSSDPEVDGALTFQEATRRFQRDLLARTLDETEWNVRDAARRLDIARSYAYQLIETYGLSRHVRDARA